MQDLTPLLKEGSKYIEAYGNGGFKISGERIEGGIILLPNSVHTFSSTIEKTSLDDLAPLVKASEDVDILLVGCGEKTDFFSPELEEALREKRMTVEYMQTGSAVRTYNVLLLEERKVAAVLIAV